MAYKYRAIVHTEQTHGLLIECLGFFCGRFEKNLSTNQNQAIDKNNGKNTKTSRKHPNALPLGLTRASMP